MSGLILLVLSAAPPSLLWSSIPSGGIVDVECAGDVNSDGTDDIFCAADENLGYGVLCVDGISGQVIWQTDSIPGITGTGCLRAVGDIDLDGICDIAAGTSASPSVVALSGIDGDILWVVPQTAPIQYIQRATGPGPGDVVILATRMSAGQYCVFFALDAQTGSELWASSSQASQDHWIRVSGSDFTGNGWSEMGYCIDRGSVYTGYAVVCEGYTGEVIQSAGFMYNGSMDLCGPPLPSLAVSNFGSTPVMWMKSLMSGTTIWSSNDPLMYFTHVDFIENITGSSYQEIVGWSGTHLTLIRGNDGYHLDRYTFPANLLAVDTYQDGTLWHLAALTWTKFHCPALVFSSPGVEPSIALPNPGGSDLCLLDSDEYPTPLVGVAISGSGLGLCAINTSWPVAAGEETSATVDPARTISLLENPGSGGITILGEGSTEVVILDIAGRVIQGVQVEPGMQISVDLAPGTYAILEKASGVLLETAVVLPEQ